MHLAFQTGDLKTIKLVEQQIWEKAGRSSILLGAPVGRETGLVETGPGRTDQADGGGKVPDTVWGALLNRNRQEPSRLQEGR